MSDDTLDIENLPDEFLLLAWRHDLIEKARNRKLGVDSVAAFAEYTFGRVLTKHQRRWVKRKLRKRRAVITSPPESAKTTTAEILMCWWIGHFPLLSNAFVSATDTAALKMAGVVTNCIEFNQKYRDVFPNILPDTDRGWSREGYWVRDASFTLPEWREKIGDRKDPTLIACGIFAAVLNGIRVTGRLEADDIHDQTSKESETLCAQVVAKVKDVLLSRVTAGGYFCLQQTRWNPKDTVAYIKTLKLDDGRMMYEIFEHPAIDEAGESYWPEEWPLERLALKRKEIGEIAWELQYMGNDKAAQGQILKAAALHKIPAPTIAILKTWQHFLGVDFAQVLQQLTQKEEDQHSRFSIADLAYNGSSLCLAAGFVDLVTGGEAVNIFFDFANFWRPVRAGIEVNAQNRRFYNDLIAWKLEKGLYWLNLLEITTTKNMMIRMDEMEPDFRSGFITVSDATVKVSDEVTYFLEQFEIEWLSFGKKGARNDTLSAAHLARRTAYNLIPHETPEQRAERLKAQQARTVSPFRAIENAYRVGGR